MMQSKHIVDPFYNGYAKQYYESVDRIDDYTLRIVGTRPSWRPLVFTNPTLINFFWYIIKSNLFCT